MAVHQCARFFFDNPRILHERSVKSIAKELASTSTYVDLPDKNLRLTTCGIVYRPKIEKIIKCYIYAYFSGGWAKADSDSAENVMSCTVYMITYAG